MRKILQEASEIVKKNILNVEDYKKFREIGRKLNSDEILYFGYYQEAMKLRLPEIAEKEGNYDWLEPEDED
tara:strand:+ start:1142 stop:1354 length:213 start_codon:yes stop_codon:yes gene_type:complete